MAFLIFYAVLGDVFEPYVPPEGDGVASMVSTEVGFHKNLVNMLRLVQNGWHFADNLFKFIVLNENCCILIQFLLKFYCKGTIDNMSVLIWVMAWRWTCDKPFTSFTLCDAMW